MAAFLARDLRDCTSSRLLSGVPTSARRAGAVSAVIGTVTAVTVAVTAVTVAVTAVTGAVTAVTGAVTAVVGAVWSVAAIVCRGRRRAGHDRRDRRDCSDRRSGRLSSTRIVPSIRLRSRTRISTRLSLALRHVPHVCPYRLVRTAEVPHSRCAPPLASFGSLAASPTSIVAPSSSESRSYSDVADPSQNVSMAKAPLPSSSSHAAGFGAGIVPWRQPGD